MSSNRGRKLTKPAPSSRSPSRSPRAKPHDLPEAEPSVPSPQHTNSSGSTSTAKAPSPLNQSSPSPSTTPTKKPVALPDSPSPQSSLTPPSVSSPPSVIRPRGHSTSALGDNDGPSHLQSPSSVSITIAELSRTMSNPVPPTFDQSASTSTITNAIHNFSSFSLSEHHPAPSYRDRSPGPLDLKGTETPPGGVSQNWWSRTEEKVKRPWQDPPKRKKTIPAEQTEGWVLTRRRVAQAAVSILGTAGDIAHEALLLSVDVLQFAPIVGLEEAARTLLHIWDSLQMVDMNRLACLRLTQRCADILLSIREEIADAGDYVGQELHAPISKLVESFTQVQTFLQKQVHRPFLKRYIKRDEILRQIAGCDAALSDSLGMFSLSIQIRILKQLQSAELKRQADQQALIDSLRQAAAGGAQAGLPEDSPMLLAPEPSRSNALLLTGVPEHPTEEAGDATPILRSSSLSPSNVTHDEVRTLLRALHDQQNEHDKAHDMVDLRQLMRTALQTNNDNDMIDVLQVGRNEMPEAIKTLQRTLEQEMEREREEMGHKESVTDLRAVSAAAGVGGFVRPMGVVRRLTGTNVRATTPTSTSTSARSQEASDGSANTRGRDTLDREFIESGIEALLRQSGPEASLPPWTITRYEVDRETNIGRGFFSKVYRGTWRHMHNGKYQYHTVAIKVLVPNTPRKLFVREIEIWKSLEHPNVLELFGASSATGEHPWFFVSPYCHNGSLVKYLKEAKRLEDVDLLKAMYDIAKGMSYLHGRGVLHGDLKAANVLVDDQIHFLVSDFGQSEMKSEAYRISGTPPPHGTLRWQAPELLEGISRLTTEVDVYAYAICCVEILTKGAVPWYMQDDDTVSRLVREENKRPPLPLTHVSSPALTHLLQLCWDRDPSKRPPFSEVERDMRFLRIKSGSYTEDSPRPPRPLDLQHDRNHSRPSPDMRPTANLPAEPEITTSWSSSDESYMTASGDLAQSPIQETYSHQHPRPGEPEEPIQMPVPRVHPPSTQSSISSLFTSTPDSRSETGHVGVYAGYESPPPIDDMTAERRDERRYRMLLTHTFHPSLTLPLWSPAPVSLGAVGYLSKPQGEFVTLFNALDPNKSSNGLITRMGGLKGFGDLTIGRQDLDRRTPVQKGFDMIQGLFNSRNQHVNREYSFDLHAGHKAAYLCAERTAYNYIEDLDGPRKWFRANVNAIMKLYGVKHRIQREDVFLVIGTLDAPDYALFVSHNHPDGQARFDVFSSPREGQEWGKFRVVDGEMAPEVMAAGSGGPVYHEDSPPPVFASKVSLAGAAKGKPDTVLIARLRFKPDATEPTAR